MSPHHRGAHPHPPVRGGAVLAYSIRWGTSDSDRAELGLVCGGKG